MNLRNSKEKMKEVMMGDVFKKTTQTMKKLDPDVVSFALSGVVIGLLTYKPQYAEELESTFIVIQKTLSKEDLTEDELHGVIEDALMDIGVKDDKAMVMIKLFLHKLDRLAEKYLDTVEGEFTQEEKDAWYSMMQNLIDTIRMYRKLK